MSTRDLVVKESDYARIAALIEGARSEASEQLEEEISRARIVRDSRYPKDAVSIGFKVKFVDLTTGKQNEATVVYPTEANLEEMKISVLTPMGSALIGMRVGGIIDWGLPGGKSARIKVLDVDQYGRE